MKEVGDSSSSGSIVIGDSRACLNSQHKSDVTMSLSVSVEAAGHAVSSNVTAMVIKAATSQFNCVLLLWTCY